MWRYRAWGTVMVADTCDTYSLGALPQPASLRPYGEIQRLLELFGLNTPIGAKRVPAPSVGAMLYREGVALRWRDCPTAQGFLAFLPNRRHTDEYDPSLPLGF